ncbi:hypothetical protein BGW38_006782 [Lunasporangiospora selenospora]|uniref:3'-phosphate/5'-hydroxy nucleic acid ligase n=1 Tax=Lunasporangiospora selenospora TaxID=979761 RepID=A0A9P6KG53_9FUNG|nr:hypothetical protein BGW38_006782 [Lunasporangiospora selenospora]
MLYLNQGVELSEPSLFFTGKIPQDSLVFVSCGEAYIGQLKADQPATVSSTSTEASASTADSTTSGVDKANESDINKNGIDLEDLEISASISILAKKSHVDPDANTQLNRTAMLPGMRRVVGQPDLHPGNQYPIGATFITQKLIYPALIGNDIGCGMAVYKTRLSSNIKPQKIVDKLHNLEGRWTEGDPEEFLNSKMKATDAISTHLDQLGTLGGGNHFAEFVVLEQLVDEELCNKYDLNESNTYLIVHSGSRKVGQSVLEHSNKVLAPSKGDHQKLQGIMADSEAGRTYLRQHDQACDWALVNRELIAQRVLTRLNAEEDAVKILDIWHNNVESKTIESIDGTRACWIHRKGAAPSDRGLVVIPGSRGHFSYLVMPHGDQEKNGFSLAHGAGRLLPRAKALQKRPLASKQASISALQTTSLGSSVICENNDLLFEEQPDAYKEITDIIDDLGPFVKVVAVLRPICTYKMRKENRT